MDHLLINARPRVFYNKILHVRRTLSGAKVKIFVEIGQEVKPTDIVAEGQTSAGFRNIPLAKELGVHPKGILPYLKRPIGQMIYQGELLAARESWLGLWKQLILSPVDGVVDYLDPTQGNLRIKLLPQKKRLASGVTGVVESVNRSLGMVVIRTAADIILGLCGCGRERSGILHVNGLSSSLVGARQIETDFQGQIIAAGSLLTRDALEKAVAIGVGGLISGGINAGDFMKMAGGNAAFFRRRWTDIGLSLLVTEGFGSVVIGDDVWQLLRKHHGRFVFIDGNQAKLVLPSMDSDSMIYIRKTKLPRISPEGVAPAVETVELKVGAKVRVVSAPYLGYQGKVEAVDRSLTRLPSGVLTYMTTIDTPGRKIQIPYTNVEAVG